MTYAIMRKDRRKQFNAAAAISAAPAEAARAVKPLRLCTMSRQFGVELPDLESPKDIFQM
jgi:hypothetical protein